MACSGKLTRGKSLSSSYPSDILELDRIEKSIKDGCTASKTEQFYFCKLLHQK